MSLRDRFRAKLFHVVARKAGNNDWGLSLDVEADHHLLNPYGSVLNAARLCRIDLKKTDISFCVSSVRCK